MIEKTALRFLAIKNRSEEELRQKLLGKGFCPQEISRVIKYLVNEGYLDDHATVTTRFKMYVSRGYGPRYITLKLKQQGLTMPSYPLTLQKQTALKLLNQLQGKTPQQQAVVLNRRGFDTQLIYELVLES
ncbi:MAG: regulatory protein RecX [Candidatus Rhabdochlamydia sp.]